MLRWLRGRNLFAPKRAAPAAAAGYRAPGVYVEEITAVPPAITAAPTDIPVFIGIVETEAAPARIASLSDYEATFGGAPVAPVRIAVAADGTVREPEWQGLPSCLLYHAVAHFFANGGRSCHVVPAGSYAGLPSRADFAAALGLADAIEDATLFAMPDALALAPTDCAALCWELLDRCGARKNAFAVLDLPGTPDAATVADFRSRIGGALSYGAVYTPFLETAFPPAIDPERVAIVWEDGSRADTTLATLADDDAVLRNAIAARLATLRIVLPPSGAVVGAICRNDRSSGVWKAPANLQLADTVAPVVDIGNAEQESLNIDASSGKSINAIRTFPGKGTLIWGARTLAGNHNEYRYVPVRRTVGMIEKSVTDGLAPFVFEPNEARTWSTAKATVETFLTGLWRDGALQGSKPDHAFFAKVGLGETMTQNDIDSGRMIVEIGVAPLRPAEFIVIRLSVSLSGD
ncbi:MAG: phage tail sheath C-terminal domain-containing protein [Rhodospirillaceae bacterium]